MNQALKIPGTSNAWTMPIKARVDMLTTGIRTPWESKSTAPTSRRLRISVHRSRPCCRRCRGRAACSQSAPAAAISWTSSGIAMSWRERFEHRQRTGCRDERHRGRERHHRPSRVASAIRLTCVTCATIVATPIAWRACWCRVWTGRRRCRWRNWPRSSGKRSGNAAR